MNKDVAKCLVAFERKFLRRMFWGINANENWRKQSNKELMQVFGDLDILSSVGLSQLNWIGHVNRMDNNRKVNQVFNNNPHSSRLRGRPKKQWWNCVQTYINKCKITNSRAQKQSRLGEVH